MSLESIKEDLKKQDQEEQRYNLTDGTHVLILNLNSKQRVFIPHDEKRILYHRFDIQNEGKESYVLFSNFLYSEFLKAIKPYVNMLENKPIIETIIKVSKTKDKTEYDVKINMDGGNK